MTVKNGVIHDGGAPRLASTGSLRSALSPVWIIGWFGYLELGPDGRQSLHSCAAV